jgi:transcriptional regulator with XRE-family HTH domain
MFSAGLRRARIRAELSRERVALTLGKSSRTIDAYESGQIVPPGNVLIELTELYGVTVEDLLSREAPAGAR